MARSNKLRAIAFVLGFCGIVLVGAWASTATAADRIVVARSVFERAGGTDKGLMQVKFKAARVKIDDALDRLAAEGILGGDTTHPRPSSSATYRTRTRSREAISCNTSAASPRSAT